MISIASKTDIASSPTGDPYLLTPGPLTTSATVKQAMLHDYGSRDSTFIEINAHILDRLVDIVKGADTHVCVPLQGSGTFVVEAVNRKMTSLLSSDTQFQLAPFSVAFFLPPRTLAMT